MVVDVTVDEVETVVDPKEVDAGTIDSDLANRNRDFFRMCLV